MTALLEEIVCRLEVLTYALLVVGICGHAHDTCYANTVKLLIFSSSQVREALICGETEFGFLLCNVELQ